MHKEILGIGKKQEGDHKNGDKLNNQRANLRTCTHAQNMFNRRTQKNNVSGVSGVSQRKLEKRWLARISVRGKCITLGAFKNKVDAIKARIDAQAQYYEEFAP